MINRYNKGCLLIFLILIAILSGCGGSATTKVGTTPTSFKNTVRPRNPGTPGTQLTVTPQPSTVSTPTPAPTPTASDSLVSGGAFTTLSPGSTLPSDAECAARVQRSSWEPRPDNSAANNTNVYAQGYRLTGSYLGYLKQQVYEQKVTGNFTGTTDEILQWGACKWGIDVDIVRAQAVKEGYWRQSTLGDCNGGTVPETNGCQSVGILQIKGANVPPTHPGTWPYAFESTAFNVDYTYAVWRVCFDGKETWLGNGYHAGDVWGCVGRWFSGDWYGNSLNYIAGVKTILSNKDWLQPGF